MAEQKQQTLDVVIAIGSTGLGKSTMIKSYCTSEAVEASSSVESCTKKSHLFKETDDRTKNVKRIWLDTMGAEDDNIQSTVRNRGWFNEEEMKIEVNKLVNTVGFVPIFVRKQKCKKCAVVGDPRWVNLRCHGQPNNIHPKGDEFVHTGSTNYVHPLQRKEKYHDGSITRYHSGSLEYEDVGRGYHSGTYLSGSAPSLESYGLFCPRCDDNIQANCRTVNSGSFECNQCKRDIDEGEKNYLCTTCEPNNFGYTITGKDGTWKGAKYCAGCLKSKQRMVGGSSGYWSCCGKESESAAGCEQDTAQKYSCCGGSSSAPGCRRKWTCCHRDADSANNGCEQRHVCCGKRSGAQGCKQVYSCCQKDVNETGCSYACCKKRIGSAKCFVECSNCHREFGKAPGCLEENVSHEMIDIQ